LNLSSALIKQVLDLVDFDTWSRVRKIYLPTEYHQLYDTIEKHVNKYHKLPSVGELKLAVRDAATLDKIYALEGIETDAEPFLLLEYLKNEFAQKEALFKLDKWVDKTIAFESAEEVVRSLQDIAMDIEKKVEIEPEEQSMQKMNLFESEEQMAKRITLGLNADFDKQYQFLANDYILMGGRRGSGKSLTCINLAHAAVTAGKTAVYFSIEMDARQTMQRYAAVATGIPYNKIRNRNLSVSEWEVLAKFWASRYHNGDLHFQTYKEHHDFERFHTALSKEDLKYPALDIKYDPHLTIAKMKAHVNRLTAQGIEIGLIIVDYINQVEGPNGSGGMYDWITQIEISKGLKQLAQDYEIPVFSPYQTDATNEARFAKGILDSADAAITLTAHDDCIEFTVTKMRNADDEITFVSVMNWDNLQIGPENGQIPEKEEEDAPKRGKGFANGKKKVNPEIYDDDDTPIMDKMTPPW
jgi:hypothetical protein